MSIAAPGRGLRPRLSRTLTAVAASIALVVAPVLVEAPAYAAPGDYVGIDQTGGSWTDGTLGAMTAGVAYSDTLRSPVRYDAREGSVTASSGLPAGLSVTANDEDFIVTVSGTPSAAGAFDFTITVPGTEGDRATIRFVSSVASGKTATTTTVTAPAVAPYSSIPLSATVAGGSPTGTVLFTVDSTAYPASPVLSGSAASTTVDIDKSHSGHTVSVVAAFSGDADYAASSGSTTVFVYGSDTVRGRVLNNGSAVRNAVVALLDSADKTVLATTTTGSTGFYNFTRTVSNQLDASTQYLLRATIAGTDYYYDVTADSEEGNVTNIADATTTGPVQWTTTGGFDIFRNVPGVPPTWTDQVLGALQAGTAFSDDVAATGDPTIGYAVTSGTLPAGLALNAVTGAVTGTPTSAGAYDFTITASNDYGQVDQNFAGTVAAAPTINLALDFKAGTPITDASSTISADGLKVGSTYTLTMHSTPVILYTGTIGASGGFTWKVSLPADTPPGAHKLILTGVTPDGTTLTRTAWFTLGSNGTITAVSLTGPTALAATGAEPQLTLAIAGSLLVFGVLLVVARRRHRA